MAADTIIDNKNKYNKQKVNFGKAEAFRDPIITNSDSYPKLYGIDSINLEEQGKNPTSYGDVRAGGERLPQWTSIL